MKRIDVSQAELWREYDFNGRIYRIDRPVDVYIGATTHRIVDKDGTVHIAPAPGNNGCVVRFEGNVIA